MTVESKLLTKNTIKNKYTKDTEMTFNFTSKFFAMTLLMVGLASPAFAQHADIEFGYDDVMAPTEMEVEVVESTIDGLPFFESEMEELDPFDPGNFSSDEPGFITNSAEALEVNIGDRVFLRVLDASQHTSFGVGYVNFFNPADGTMSPGGQMSVFDNTVSETPDLIFDGTTIISGENPQLLGVGNAQNDGGLHEHITIDILNEATAPIGAYGILFQMESDLAPVDGVADVISEPFWIIWNYQMDEEDFESLALQAFGALEGEAVVANAFSVVRGFPAGGDLNSTLVSDDQFLQFNPGFTLNNLEAPVQLQFDGQLATPTPQLLALAIEAQASTPGLQHEVSVFNYTTGQMDLLNMNTPGFNTDTFTIVDLSGDVADYVSANGEVQTLQAWRQVGFTLQFPWTVSIDSLAWVAE